MDREPEDMSTNEIEREIHELHGSIRIRCLFLQTGARVVKDPGLTEKVRINGQDWHGWLLVVRLSPNDRGCSLSVLSIIIVYPSTGASRIARASSRKL